MTSLRRASLLRAEGPGVFQSFLSPSAGDFLRCSLWQPGPALGGKSHNNVGTSRTRSPGVFDLDLPTLNLQQLVKDGSGFPTWCRCPGQSRLRLSAPGPAAPCICLSVSLSEQQSALCFPLSWVRSVAHFPICSAFCFLSGQSGDVKLLA